MLAELLATPGVEEEAVLRSRFGFLAIHGGSLERRTDTVAATAARLAGASLYAVRQPPDFRWHVPSTAFDPGASAQLRRFLDHVDVVVSVHGYGRRDLRDTLLLGGRNRALARHLGGALRAALPGYAVIDDLDDIPPALRGIHRANPVNRPPRGGVQLELPPRVRGLAPTGPVESGRDGLGGPVEVLVHTLAATAASWDTDRGR